MTPLSRRELTPGADSATAVVDAPVAPPLGPAVTTSLRELPPVPFPATRRPLPFVALAVVVVFSLVLDASDLESSG